MVLKYINMRATLHKNQSHLRNEHLSAVGLGMRLTHVDAKHFVSVTEALFCAIKHMHSISVMQPPSRS